MLAGGVAVGAYEAGACAALFDVPHRRPEWIAGSSIGGVNAAILAGNAPQRRLERLRAFWDDVAEEPFPLAAFWMSFPAPGPWRQWLSEKSVLDSVLFGRPALFRPRLMPGERSGVPDVPGLFDLAPLRRSLHRAIDFDVLNAGATRLTLCCTDVLSGERVVFDTARGDRIGVQHILASCALLPLFAPIEVDGRLLADGALCANAPVDLVLDEAPADGMVCYVVELFARSGQRPRTLAASANRATDLAFGNQTRRALEAWAREDALRRTIHDLGERLPQPLRDEPEIARLLREGRPGRTVVATIAYHGGLDEAGVFKAFDFSRARLTERWHAGAAAMRAVLAAQA